MKVLNFRLLIALGLISLPMILSSPAKALSKITVEDPIDSVTEISVPTGHNVVLSFENNRYVQAVWIDDPSILGIATDRALCGQGGGNGCGYATTLRLTRLTGANTALQGASFQQGNGRVTVLNVITTNASGGDNQTYQFAISVGGNSGISQVSIVPQSTPDPSSINRRLAANVDVSQLDIASVRSGMQVALDEGRANTSSAAWIALEQFIELVEAGSQHSDAALQTGVSSRLLIELERIGNLDVTRI
ncbi:MAG: hypothetical protein AAFZ17_01890 [Cyanobacteria bacterium J06650_10]